MTVVALARDAALTLDELIRSPPLRDSGTGVVAGADRLDVPIRWVHTGERASIGSLLRGGELLLTTGAGLDRDPRQQREFVDAIVDQGGVGIVLQMGVVLREVPPALLARAIQHDLPLVTVQQRVRFADVTEIAHRRILRGQADARIRADATYRDLLGCLLDGGDTSALLERLAQRLHLPLSIQRQDGHTLFVTRAAGATTVGGDAQAASFPVRAPDGGAPLQLTPSSVRELDATERATLSRACDLLALSLLRARQEEALLARESGDLLSGLMFDELSADEAEARAAELGWPGYDVLLAAAVGGRSPQHLRAERETWSAIMRECRRTLASEGISMLAGPVGRGDSVVAIIGVPSSPLAGAVRPRPRTRHSAVLERAATVLREHVARWLPHEGQVVLCVAEPARAWPELASRLREVVRLAPTSVQAADAGWVDFGALDVDLLLRGLLGDEVLERFVDRRLASLGAHADLVQTLETLFDRDGNKANAARVLQLDRKSLYAQLRQIETLLGESLEDEETRLGLQLALHVRRARASFAHDVG